MLFWYGGGPVFIYNNEYITNNNNVMNQIINNTLYFTAAMRSIGREKKHWQIIIN